jgi:hypothetical protein
VTGADRQPSSGRRHCAGLDCSDATFNFSGPGRSGVRIRRTVKARQQFGGELGACVKIKAQGVGKNSLSGLRHTKILRSDSPP